MLQKSAQAGQHSFKERQNDCYETPACAIEALLRVESLPHHILEPACGPGAIVKVLEKHDHHVIASDLYKYERGISGMDFFDYMTDWDCIITNPPYQLAEKFVRHALTISPLVIMLLRLAFLESVRRTDILENSGLARIHVFANRLPMMHRVTNGVEWQGRRASSAMPFAWFVWCRDHTGPTTIDRIRWT
jgi:hypothetical protein